MIEHRLAYRVAWGDTDAAGIVYYPNYYRMFDLGTHGLLRVAGFSLPDARGERFSLPLIESHARYRSSLVYDDEVEIVTRVAEIRTRALRLEHQIEKLGRVVCGGYEVRMWVRLGDGGVLEPAPLPDGLRNVLMGNG
jgi:YbgC/YbaW family acyl-CoA thioester hydrolase